MQFKQPPSSSIFKNNINSLNSTNNKTDSRYTIDDNLDDVGPKKARNLSWNKKEMDERIAILDKMAEKTRKMSVKNLYL